MPPFGLTHKLLSARHPDTEAPAAGADPDDGQVATWSTALKAWIAADPAGGVTDHGLLSGLYPDDDHAQYALADKSRPTTWVEAADLAARSIADLGTKDHDLLDGLTDDDHVRYAYLPGRSGGQTFVGGSGSGEHLTLQSTSHATRGYVKAQDDLQLLSNIIRDSGGTARVTLATALPHVTLAGDIRAGDRVGIGTDPNAYTGLKVVPSLSATTTMSVIAGDPTVRLTGGMGSIYGFKAAATGVISAGATLLGGYGLSFFAIVAGGGTVNELQCMWLRAGLQAYTGPACDMWGIKVSGPYFFFSTYPTVSYGIEIGDQGAYAAGTHDAIGLKIADQTATAGDKRLIEAGPATPYLRLVGGADPAANESNLSLKFGATLKQLTEYDADSAGVGYRALRVPN